MSDHPTPEPNCLNCGAELQGKFCHACGQKGSSMNVRMHDFVHEVTHEFLHLDGKILQTVKLLVARPGELTREFLAGRRARYISPLRVYLTFSLLFFTLAAVLPRTPQGVVKLSRTSEGKTLQGDTEFERRLLRGLNKAEHDAESLGQAILHNLPKAMFVLMPLFALLTWAFYRKQQRFYIPHLYYSVHFHAFTFLVMSVYALVSRVIPKQVAVLVLLTAIPYHFIALRRVFGGSRWMTFAKGTAVGVLYWISALAAVMVVTIAVLINL